MSGIRTSHIRLMLTQAHEIADQVEYSSIGDTRDYEVTSDTGEKVTIIGVTTEEALERAANLAEHAAAELRDELTGTLNHWPR